MAGEARFVPSEEDAVDAGRDGFSRYLRQPSQRNTLFWLAAALALVGLALALSRSQRFDWLLWPCLYVLLGLAALLAATILGHSATLGRRARRLFRQDKGVHVEQVFAWTDEGLSFRSSAAEGRLGWSDLYRWSEGRRTFLFWTTELTSIYLPRRCLDGPLEEDLRRVLVRFGPPRF